MVFRPLFHLCSSGVFNSLSNCLDGVRYGLNACFWLEWLCRAAAGGVGGGEGALMNWKNQRLVKILIDAGVEFSDNNSRKQNLKIRIILYSHDIQNAVDG